MEIKKTIKKCLDLKPPWQYVKALKVAGDILDYEGCRIEENIKNRIRELIIIIHYQLKLEAPQYVGINMKKADHNLMVLNQLNERGKFL